MRIKSAKKIGIYQSYWGSLGGGGVYVGALAQTLAPDHDVEVIHHRPNFDPSTYEEALGVDLSRVRFREVEHFGRPRSEGSPWHRYVAERDFAADLSRPYDVFINSAETPPPFCHARRGVLISWFPFVSQDAFHGRDDEGWQGRPAWRRWFEHRWHDFEWRQRFAGYQWGLTCSAFSQRWLERSWHRSAAVVYPPITRRFTPRAKEPLVVSLSRFQASRSGHHKKHLDLIEAFLQLASGPLEGWRYVIMGGLHSRHEDEEYFAALRAVTAGTSVQLVPNADGQTVRDNLERASLFWHGTGFGEDPELHPARMEHFGIATVEAMAAGTVPIVFGAGGQREIVAHGQNGFLWQTLKELQQYSVNAVAEPERRSALAASAQERANDFSLERFSTRAKAVLRPVLES